MEKPASSLRNLWDQCLDTQTQIDLLLNRIFQRNDKVHGMQRLQQRQTAISSEMEQVRREKISDPQKLTKENAVKSNQRKIRNLSSGTAKFLQSIATKVVNILKIQILLGSESDIFA